MGRLRANPVGNPGAADSEYARGGRRAGSWQSSGLTPAKKRIRHSGDSKRDNATRRYRVAQVGAGLLVGWPRSRSSFRSPAPNFPVRLFPVQRGVLRAYASGW
jgi:hypothetical protein